MRLPRLSHPQSPHDDPGVAGLPTGIEDLVVLDQVLVAAVLDGDVGGAVDEVVGRLVAGSLVKPDRLRVGALPASEVVDVAVAHVVAPRRQGAAVTSRQADRLGAYAVELAVEHADAGAAVGRDPLAADVAQNAAVDHRVARVRDDDAVAAGQLEGQSLEADMADAVETDEGRAGAPVQGQHDLGGIQLVRRPEIELAVGPFGRIRVAFEVPLPGQVDLLEEIEAVPEAAGRDRVPRAVGDGEDVGDRVDGGDRQVLVRPQVAPVPVDPGGGGFGPAVRAVVVVHEGRLAEGPVDQGEVLVRPAAQGKDLAVEAQLGVDRPVVRAGEVAEAGDAEGGKVAFDEVSPGRRIDPVPDGGVRPRSGEAGRVDGGPADEAGGLAVEGPVRNRGSLTAGIPGTQAELRVPEVAAAPDPDSSACASGIARCGSAHGVAGALEAGVGSLPGAGVGVVPVRGDEKLDGASRRRRDQAGA